MAWLTVAEVKRLLQIDGEEQDEAISFLLPYVEADYLFIRGKGWDKNDDDVQVVPPEAPMTGALMIRHHLQNFTWDATGQGVRSERLGDYAITYSTTGVEDRLRMYPLEIISRVRKYVRWQ